MSTYVIADVHGCYTEFIDLLKKVGFCEQDRLIVAGDIIDRGKESHAMLQWMEKKFDNVDFIMGNHDRMFVESVAKLADFSKVSANIKEAYREVKLYDPNFDRYMTIRDLIRDHGVGLATLIKWAKIINSFPYTIDLTINGREYIVVHAGYMEEGDLKDTDIDLSPILNSMEKPMSEQKYFYLWAREEALKVGGKENTTIIAGHTPTVADSEFYTGGTVFKYENKEKNSVIYDIDCGCVFYGKIPGANLACIRLEDEKVFYLYEKKPDTYYYV